VPPRLRLPAAFAATLVVAEAAVLLLRPKERFAVAPAEPRAYFSAAELEKAKRFRSGQLKLFGARTALELGVLGLSVARPPRAGRRPVLTGAATAAGMSLTSTVAGLPLRAMARRQAKDVGLVTQSWGGWAGDVAKSTALGGAFAAAAGAALTAGMSRFGRHWWAPGAGVASGVAIALVFVGPVALDPLFNKFTPLPAGQTRSTVFDLARRAGVEVGQVYEMDASKRTTAANAYVTGLGRTKRVVLYDTLLEHFTRDEVRLVVAHELAHVRHRDVPRSLLFLALTAPASLWAASLLLARLDRSGAPPGPQTVPALAAAVGLVALPVGLAGNRLSRRVEARADSFSLRLTDAPEPFISFERRIAVRNVADPAPPRLRTLLLATHPPTVERIGIARAYEAGAR
jgi:Zn-dependent protease with chaperone function